MIELRGVVVAAGTRPVSATIRAGEIVRVDGPHAAALCEVLAGRRAPVAGAVIRRGTRSAILLRASDRLPGDAADALRLFAALAGAAPGAIALPEGDEARAIARARVVAPDLWIVDGVLGAAAEELVQAAAEEIRAGGAAMVWTAAADPRRGRVDRVITIEVGEGAAAGEAAPRATGRGGGVAAYVTATAASRAALGFAALAAGCLALVAWTVAAHEGFWFAPGSAAAMDPVGPIAVATIAVLAGVMAAVRAAAAPTWPAMLRDTGVAAPRRVAAVVAGDVAPVLPAAAVAALASVALAPVVVAAAVIAAGASRLVRGGATGAALGAVAGGAVTAILLW